MSPQPLAPGAPAPGSSPFDSCGDPGGRGPSARPSPASAALPAWPAKLDLGSVAIGLDGRAREAPSSSLFSVSEAPSCLPLSPCTCPAAPQPWPTAASHSPATCSAARAAAPRGCTASKPSWDLPRTTGSSAPSQRSRAPGARRSETGGRAPGLPAPRRPREAPSPAHRPPRSTKVSAHPGCCEPAGSPDLDAPQDRAPCVNFYQGAWVRV